MVQDHWHWFITVEWVGAVIFQFNREETTIWPASKISHESSETSGSIRSTGKTSYCHYHKGTGMHTRNECTLNPANMTIEGAPTPGGEPASDCSTGPIQCCNTVTQGSDPAAAGVLAGLGIVLQDVNVLVGLTCTPVTVIGAGGSGCSANPVCCEDNSHGGLVSIGCVPVDLSL